MNLSQVDTKSSEYAAKRLKDCILRALKKKDNREESQKNVTEAFDKLTLLIAAVFEEYKLSILLDSEKKTTEYTFETDLYGINKEKITCEINVFEVKTKKAEIMFAPVKKDFDRMPNALIYFKLHPNFPEQDELNSASRYTQSPPFTPTPKTNIAETYFLSYIVDDGWTLTVYHTPKPKQPQEKLLEEKLNANGILRIFYSIFHADLTA